MTIYLRVDQLGNVWERGACGSWHCYHGEAAEVMRLVLRYSA